MAQWETGGDACSLGLVNLCSLCTIKKGKPSPITSPFETQPSQNRNQANTKCGYAARKQIVTAATVASVPSGDSPVVRKPQLPH